MDNVSDKRVIEVVGAAIIHDGKLLAMQRSEKMTLPGLWEFPGGKIEKGESAKEALIREIQEELALEIEVEENITTTAYEYDFGIVKMSTYRAKMKSEHFVLKEHAQYRWLSPNEVMTIEWAPVDIPTAKILENNY